MNSADTVKQVLSTALNHLLFCSNKRVRPLAELKRSGIRDEAPYSISAAVQLQRSGIRDETPLACSCGVALKQVLSTALNHLLFCSNERVRLLAELKGSGIRDGSTL